MLKEILGKEHWNKPNSALKKKERIRIGNHVSKNFFLKQH